MALIKCPECGNECSDQAETCPKCGYPLKEKKVEQPIKVEYEYLETEIINVGIIGSKAIFEKRLQPYLDEGWEVVDKRMPVIGAGALTQVYKVKLRRPVKVSLTDSTKK